MKVRFLLRAVALMMIVIGSMGMENTLAEGPKVTETERHLTGRSVPLASAIGMSGQILVGNIRDVGGVDAGAPGQKYYSKASVSVLHWLRGKPAEDVHAEPLTFAYTVQSLPQAVHEETLIAGERYIFFFSGGPDNRVALKVLPAGDQEVARVKEALPLR